jgi:hypothetical protein
MAFLKKPATAKFSASRFRSPHQYTNSANPTAGNKNIPVDLLRQAAPPIAPEEIKTSQFFSRKKINNSKKDKNIKAPNRPSICSKRECPK